jgi:hypothetical protein
MELGCSLGEIRRLKSFEAKPLAEIIAYIDSTRCPRERKEHYKNFELNLMGCPWPFEARARDQNPSYALFPVLFLDPEAAVFYIEYGLYAVDPDESTTLSTQTCDERAREAFRKLQEVALPQVYSPAIY